MELDVEIKNIIEELAKDIKPNILKEISTNISKNYLNNDKNNSNFIYDKNYALAYGIMRLPATFSALNNVLEHVFEVYKDNIKTILDVGAGMGTSALALSSFVDNCSYTLIEREESMIEIGNKILTYKNIDYQYVKDDVLSYQINKEYDLIIFSYSLNEFNRLKQEELIKKYLPFAKLLVVVDPGTPASYDDLIQIKNLINDLGYNVIAPCCYKTGCPLINDWCCFSTRLSRTSLHKYLKSGDAPFEDEKFSYLAISKYQNNNKICRILRHPKIKSNSINVILCSKDGIINKEIYKKDKLIYKKCKKSHTGDIF